MDSITQALLPSGFRYNSIFGWNDQKWEVMRDRSMADLFPCLPVFQVAFWWWLPSTSRHSSCLAAPLAQLQFLPCLLNITLIPCPLGLGWYWLSAVAGPRALPHPLLVPLTLCVILQIVPLFVSLIKHFGVCHLFPARSLANTRRQTNKYVIKVYCNKDFNGDMHWVL